MRVWKLGREVDNYENLIWGENERDIDLSFIQSFNGIAKSNEWKPLYLRSLNNGYDFSNTPGLSAHIPVFDEKVINVVGDLLTGNAEILPVFCEDRELFIINVIKVLDCIDYKNAEYKTFKDGVRIMRYTKYAFDEDIIKGIHIFKIKDEPLKSPFVSDEFRNRIMNSSLTGFKFELVWDSNI